MQTVISNESYIILVVVAVLALVALIYLLSPMSLIDELIARGAVIRARLWDRLERHAYPDDTRSVWVAGSIAVALEHHEAISLLIERQLTGSAFALVRSMVDTVVRAHWINAVASEDQVEQAREDENVFPSMSEMSKTVGKAYGTDELFGRFTAEWRAMCSYTHSGALQIGYRFTGTDVKPSYKKEAKVQVLNLTNMAVLFLAGMFFMSTGHQPEADETRTMLLDYTSEFGERLRAVIDNE
jgi:Family of unknown function (DUF6988)